MIENKLKILCKNCGFEQSIKEDLSTCKVCSENSIAIFINDKKYDIKEIDAFKKQKEDLYYLAENYTGNSIKTKKSLIGYIIIDQDKIKLEIDKSFNAVFENENILKLDWELKNKDKYQLEATIFPLFSDFFTFRKKYYICNLHSSYDLLTLKNKNCQLKKYYDRYFLATNDHDILDILDVQEVGDKFIYKKDTGYGLCDIKLHTIIEFSMEKLDYNLESNILIGSKNGESSLYDLNGKELVQKKYKHIEYIGHKLFKIINKKEGVVDNKGNIILEEKCTNIKKTKYFLKAKYDNKYKIYNFLGKQIGDEEYSSIELHMGYYIVKHDNKAGIIGLDGNIILPVEYSEITEFGQETLKLENIEKVGLYGIFEEKIILDCIYKNISKIIEGKYIINEDDTAFYFYDLISRKILSDEKFIRYNLSSCGDFIDLFGLDKNGFYSIKARSLFLESNISFSNWSYNGVRSYTYYDEHKYGLINRKGKKISERKYTKIERNLEGILCHRTFRNTLYDIDYSGEILSKKYLNINKKFVLFSIAIFLAIVVTIKLNTSHQQPKMKSTSTDIALASKKLKKKKAVFYTPSNTAHSIEKYTYKEAIIKCKNIASGNWKLPSSKIMLSLVTKKSSYGGVNLPVTMAKKDYDAKQNSWYWTSTSINEKYAYMINYYHANGLEKSNKQNKYMIKCYKEIKIQE